MRDALEKTPTQLEVLRQAGVVDSGGAGLVYIFHGMEKALNGEQYEENTPTRVKDNGPRKPDLSKFNENSDLTYGYCTEFILQLMTAKVGDVSKFDEQPIFDYLNQNGESVVAFRDGSIIRVHIHTKTPGEILNHCQIWGEFLTLKIENMTIQHNQSIVQNNYSAPEEDIVLRTGKPKKKYATVTVATGEGICNLFREIGVDAVINKKILSASRIFRFTLTDKIRSIKYLSESDAVALEYIVHPGSPVTKAPIKDLAIPRTAIIGGVIRGTESFIAYGNTQIAAYDHVVVFTLPSSLKEIDKLFM